MTELFANALLYLPPLACALAYFMKERKRQSETRRKNPILLYLAPIGIFAVASALWSLAILGILSVMG